MPVNQRQIIEQANFAYSPSEKNPEKQVDAIKFLDPSNKLKQIEGMFPQNLMNDLISAKKSLNCKILWKIWSKL